MYWWLCVLRTPIKGWRRRIASRSTEARRLWTRSAPGVDGQRRPSVSALSGVHYSEAGPGVVYGRTAKLAAAGYSPLGAVAMASCRPAPLLLFLNPSARTGFTGSFEARSESIFGSRPSVHLFCPRLVDPNWMSGRWRIPRRFRPWPASLDSFQPRLTHLFFLHQSETSDGTTGVVLWCARAWCYRVFFRPNRLRFGGGLLGWARVPFAIGVVNGFRPSHSSFAFCFYRIFTGCYRVLVTRPTLKGVVVFDAPGTEFLFFCFYFWPNPSSWRRFRSMLTGWRRVSTTTTRCLRNFETKPTRFWWRGAFGFDSRGFFWLFGVFFFLFTGRDSGSTVVYRVECGCDSPSGAVDGFLSLGAVSGAAGRPPQRDVDGKRRRMRPTLPSCCFFLFSLFLFFFMLSLLLLLLLLLVLLLSFGSSPCSSSFPCSFSSSSSSSSSSSRSHRVSFVFVLFFIRFVAVTVGLPARLLDVCPVWCRSIDLLVFLPSFFLAVVTEFPSVAYWRPQ